MRGYHPPPVVSPSAADPSPAAAPVTIATERVTACPVCASRAGKPWLAGARDQQQPAAAERYGFRDCSGCGALYLDPRPVPAELDKVYFSGYEPYQVELRTPVPPPRPSLATRLLAPLGLAIGVLVDRIARDPLPGALAATYAPERPGDVLVDYGCGAPTFLDGARERGWRTVGVDFDERVLATVREHGHRAALVGGQFDRDVADGSVGCIRMNHVVEHLYEPRDVLAQLLRKLRPGGRLHVATPNPAAASARLFGRRWYGLETPRHAVLWRPAVLRDLLLDVGFASVEVVQEPSPKDVARSWGIVLHERGRLSAEQWRALTESWPRLRLLRAPTRLAALAGAGERFHAFAIAPA